MTPPNDPFFAPVSRTPRNTRAGVCDVPILYWDAGMVGLLYRVAPERTRGLVSEDFEPWVVFGKAIAMFCFFEYRQTSIGPYGEVGLGLLVKRKGSSPSLLRALADMRKETDCGLHVINLPVTSESACAAGKEIWGYPKYVTPMETSFRPHGVRFALGREIVMTMGASGKMATAGLPFVLYSVSDEARILRTVIDVDHRQRWGGAGTVKIEVTGDGPTARTVKALGLDAAAPMLAFRTDGMRSILPAGTDMGAAISKGAQSVSTSRAA